MELNLDNVEKIKPLRDEKGRLLPNQPSINPAGRPKGQSLKEYWRQRFLNMTEDEKIEFTKKVGNAEIWRMAEGNPKQDVDSKVEVTLPIPILGNVPTDNSNKEDTGIK